MTYTQSVALEAMACIHCGAVYAISKAVCDQARQSGGYHYCPHCRGNQGWRGEAEDQRRAAEIANLKAQISRADEQARRARQDAEHFEKSRNAYKGQVTKIKARAGRGMCPCCNRFFENLHRHMATKHPEFADADHHEASEKDSVIEDKTSPSTEAEA